MAGIGDYKGEGEFTMKPSEFYGYGNQKKDISPLKGRNIDDQANENTCAAYGNPKPSKEDRAKMLACPNFSSNKAKQGVGF